MPDPANAAGRTGAYRWWQRCVLESTLGLLRRPDVFLALMCCHSRLEIPLLWRAVPSAGQCLDVGCTHLLIHLRSRRFSGTRFLRVVSLEVSDTICRSSLAYEGPVGTPILTWHQCY